MHSINYLKVFKRGFGQDVIFSATKQALKKEKTIETKESLKTKILMSPFLQH